MFEKINDYLLRNLARSKVNYLFMVSKKHLFTRIHELSEQVTYLSNANDFLSDRADILNTELTSLKQVKNQSKAHTGFNYELAYKGLVKEYEDLRNENKSIKATLEVVGNVVENTKKQNEQLKDRLKRVESKNTRLEEQNKTLQANLMKEQEYSASVDLKNKVVKHNFTKKNSNVIARQVGN